MGRVETAKLVAAAADAGKEDDLGLDLVHESRSRAILRWMSKRSGNSFISMSKVSFR